MALRDGVRRLARPVLACAVLLCALGIPGPGVAADFDGPDGRILMAVDAGRVTVKPDGSDVRLLGPNQAQTRLSPDGRRIAYLDLRTRELKVANLDGSGVTAMPSPADPEGYTFHLYQSIDWSPDGERLVFGYSKCLGADPNRVGNVGGGIWRVDADGTDLVRLTTNPHCEGRDGAARFSPDGKRVAFTRLIFYPREPSGEEHQSHALMSVDAHRGAAGDLTTVMPPAKRTSSFTPTWSATGLLAFGHVAETGKAVYTWAPGSAPRRLLAAPDLETITMGLAFTPDGTKLAVGNPSTDSLDVHSPTTGALLHSAKVPVDVSYVRDLVPSPDGTRVALVTTESAPSTSRYKAWTVGTDGSAPQRLPAATELPDLLDWRKGAVSADFRINRTGPGTYQLVSEAKGEDGAALDLQWDTGNGEPTGIGTSQSVRYLKPGTYTVTHTATDTTTKASATVTKQIVVAAPELSVAIELDQEGTRLPLDQAVDATVRVSAGSEGVGSVSGLAFADGATLVGSPPDRMRLSGTDPRRRSPSSPARRARSPRR